MPGYYTRDVRSEGGSTVVCIVDIHELMVDPLRQAMQQRASTFGVHRGPGRVTFSVPRKSSPHQEIIAAHLAYAAQVLGVGSIEEVSPSKVSAFPDPHGANSVAVHFAYPSGRQPFMPMTGMKIGSAVRL